jgi:hypothetical protein
VKPLACAGVPSSRSLLATYIEEFSPCVFSIADKFEKAGIDGLSALSCEVISNPEIQRWCNGPCRA